MQKLYILGLLAISTVDAYIGGTIFAPTGSIIIADPLVNPLRISFTYTASTDCYVGSTTTTLNANTNFYSEYYSFNMPKGI